MYANVQGASATPDTVAPLMLRNLEANIQAESATPDNVDLAGTTDLFSNISAESATPEDAESILATVAALDAHERDLMDVRAVDGVVHLNHWYLTIAAVPV